MVLEETKRKNAWVDFFLAISLIETIVLNKFSLKKDLKSLSSILQSASI